MLNALIVICSIIAFFVIVCCIPIKFTVKYGNELKMYLSVLFIRIPFAPAKKRKVKLRNYSLSALEKQAKKNKKKALKKAEKKKKKSALKEKKKRSFGDILELISCIKEALEFLFSQFSNRLRIKCSKANIVVASDNSAKTAILYGTVCASLTQLCAFLDGFCAYNSKDNKNISVRADFLSENWSADIDLRFKIYVFDIFCIIFSSIPIIKKIVNKI